MTGRRTTPRGHCQRVASLTNAAPRRHDTKLSMVADPRQQRFAAGAEIEMSWPLPFVNDLRLTIKLHSKNARAADLTKGIEHLGLV